MADIADLGNDLAQSQLDDALRAVPKPEPIVGSPTCLNCGEVLYSAPLSLPTRWCDAACRDDWEKREGGKPVHIDLRGKGLVGSGRINTAPHFGAGA